jgi:hypothetical protein
MNIMKFHVRTEESPIKTLCDDSYYKALRIYLYNKGHINSLNSPVDQYSEEFTTPKDPLYARFYIKMQIENKDFTFDCEVRDGMSDHGSGDLCISNDENFNDSYSIELTKNSDGESGNMDEQRLSKDVDAVLFNEKTIDSEVNGKKNPNRHDKTRRVFSTLGIKIYNSKISEENITKLSYPPYSSLEEATEWLKKSQTGIFYDNSKNNITSTVKLHKGKSKINNISDPSVGFVIGSLRLISHFVKNAKQSINFSNHQFPEPSKYFNGNSKLVKWIQKLEMNFTYDTK